MNWLLSKKFIFVLRTWSEISCSASKESLIKTGVLFKKKIYLCLLLKEQLWPFCVLSMWFLNTAWTMWLTTEATEPVWAPVPVQLSGWQSPAGGSSILHCQNYFGIKSSSACFPLLIFCLDPSTIFCLNRDEFHILP